MDEIEVAINVAKWRKNLRQLLWEKVSEVKNGTAHAKITMIVASATNCNLFPWSKVSQKLFYDEGGSTILRRITDLSVELNAILRNNGDPKKMFDLGYRIMFKVSIIHL